MTAANGEATGDCSLTDNSSSFSELSFEQQMIQATKRYAGMMDSVVDWLFCYRLMFTVAEDTQSHQL